MFKIKQIFHQGPASNKKAKKEAFLDKKMDDLLVELAQEGIAPEKIHELRERFERATGQLPQYREFSSKMALKAHEMDIILSNVQIESYAPRISKVKQVSIVFRMIVAVLMITLGFGMIILPTPGTFEIYTLFYFNAQDGFTVMDLISLIIVFAGIYTLITIKRK